MEISQNYNYSFKFFIFRGNNHHQARANPYQMPQNYAKNAALDYNVGRFIDDETEMEFILSRMELPNTPTHESEDEKQSMSAVNSFFRSILF